MDLKCTFDLLCQTQDHILNLIEKTEDAKIKQMLLSIESKITSSVISLGTIEAYLEKK
jgi:hypothetical protein